MNEDNILTAEDVARIKSRPIDLSDMPEMTEEDFSRMRFRNQPPQFTKIIDSENLEWLLKGHKDVQTQLNYVVRWAREHNCPIFA